MLLEKTIRNSIKRSPCFIILVSFCLSAKDTFSQKSNAACSIEQNTHLPFCLANIFKIKNAMKVETILGLYKFINQLLVSIFIFLYMILFSKNQPDTFLYLFANFHDRNYNKKREKLPWIFWQQLMSKMEAKLYYSKGTILCLNKFINQFPFFQYSCFNLWEKVTFSQKSTPVWQSRATVLYLFKIKTAIKADKNILREYFDNRTQLMRKLMGQNRGTQKGPFSVYLTRFH